MNIVEIIKKAPKDHVYWNILNGECSVVITNDRYLPIRVIKEGYSTIHLYEDGKFFENGADGECILFPSKDNRDWTAFESELDEKERLRFVPEDGSSKYYVKDDEIKDSRLFTKDNFNDSFKMSGIPDRPMMAAVICAGLLAGGCKDKGAALINKAVNYADMILDYTKEESNERNNN